MQSRGFGVSLFALRNSRSKGWGMVRARSDRAGEGNPPWRDGSIKPVTGITALFRLGAKHAGHIPEFIMAARKYMGRPYDIRYRMDDEKIYCSELIFKGYRDATGEELGKLVKFGDLKWVRHTPVILAIEGSLPLNRIMITPRHLSEARQLEKVFSSKGKIRSKR